MNVDQYVENNPMRFEMIGKACKGLAIAGTPIDRATLAAALPNDFMLDDSDPWRMIAAETQKSVADGTMTAVETPDVVTTPEPTTRESLAARKLSLERRAAALRGERDGLVVARANARARFSDALQEWLTGRPKITPEANARQFIASSIAERAKPYAAQQPSFGPSKLDRHRGYGVGGSVDDRGGNHRRGAFPSQMRGAKLPSQG